MPTLKYNFMQCRVLQFQNYERRNDCSRKNEPSRDTDVGWHFGKFAYSSGEVSLQIVGLTSFLSSFLSIYFLICSGSFPKWRGC